jgi:hypothetical protein
LLLVVDAEVVVVVVLADQHIAIRKQVDLLEDRLDY